MQIVAFVYDMDADIGVGSALGLGAKYTGLWTLIEEG